MKISSIATVLIVSLSLSTADSVLYYYYDNEVDTAKSNELAVKKSLQDIRLKANCINMHYIHTETELLDGDLKKLCDTDIDEQLQIISSIHNVSSFVAIKSDYTKFIDFAKISDDKRESTFTNFLTQLSNTEQKTSLILQQVTQSLVNRRAMTMLFYIISQILTYIAIYAGHKKITRDFGMSVDDVMETVYAYSKHDLASWLQCAKTNINDLKSKNYFVEDNLKRLNKMYKIYASCNQAILESQSRHDLFVRICSDAVNFGGISMAWIGIVEDDNVTVAASHGKGKEYLETIDIRVIAASPHGNGPVGTSIRTDTPYWCNDYKNDSNLAPWHDRGEIQNWNSMCSIPIHENGKVVGSLAMYSDKLNLFDEYSKNLLMAVASAVDTALLKFYQKYQLEETASLLQTVLDTVPIRIFWKDLTSTYLGCNKLFAEDADSSVDYIKGKQDSELHWAKYADNYKNEDLQVINTRTKREYLENTIIRGRQSIVHVTKVPFIRNGEVIGVLGMIEDVTEQKTNEQIVQNFANYDQLTGTYNKAHFDELVSLHINSAKRNNEQFALIVFSIDKFRYINDTLGHDSGDNILRIVASRTQSILRAEDLLARLGGDTFMLLCPDVNSMSVFNVVRKIQATVDDVISMESTKLTVTLSFGIALYPDCGHSFDILLKHANIAMEFAKRSGTAQISVYHNQMKIESARYLTLASEMLDFVDFKSLYIVYQPQIDINGDEISAEALIRWCHPEYGNIEPAEILRIAEDTGKVSELGEYVLRQSMETALEIRKRRPGFFVSVNVSIQQFNGNLIDHTLEIMRDMECSAEHLEFEFQAKTVCDNYESAEKIFLRLTKLGFSLTMDDFGNGVSLMRNLRQLSILKIKIDKTFIDNIHLSKEDYVIAKSIIVMAKSLDIEVVAVGVETQKQLEILRELGCDKIQGYYISKPLTATQLMYFIEQYSPQ